MWCYPLNFFSAICCMRVKARGPQCLVASICGIRLTLSRHCQVYVLHTSYIVQTVSIYMVPPPPSCVFNNGKSVKQEGHKYAAKSVLDVFSQHRAAQFGRRDTKVCLRSKHESLACVQGDGFPIFSGYCQAMRRIYIQPPSPDMSKMEAIYVEIWCHDRTSKAEKHIFFMRSICDKTTLELQIDC